MNSECSGFGSINSFAVRVALFASRVIEAHDAGFGPGRHTEPWSVDFQRLAALVFAETLHPAYRRGVADSSLRVAELMDRQLHEADIGDSWHKMSAYLRTTGQALLADPEVQAISPQSGATQIAATPPAHMRHEVFAELLHPQGARDLHGAAVAVAHYCDAQLPAAPTALELEWIISVAAQEPIDALADRNGVSVRGMYRRLASMWKRLGVATQVQGVALAVQQGWIAPLAHAAAEQQSPLRAEGETAPMGQITAEGTLDGWSTVPSEPQLLCLQGLANGQRQQDIAGNLGYSRRHLQRVLAELWTQLEVSTPSQGVAHAVVQGWITVERSYA